MKIGYLFYDLLNLYGENANFRIIERSLKELNIDFESVFIAGNDYIDFDSFDFIYVGFGTERNLEIAFNKLKKYKNEISKYIESGKILLSTGNSIELFSKDYLDILDYSVVLGDKRFLMEPYLEFECLNRPLIGIYNQINTINNANLFKVLRGYKSEFEGYTYKGFYGTYLIGPILARNPHFLEFIIGKMLSKKIKLELDLEYTAYDNFIKNIDEGLKKKD